MNFPSGLRSFYDAQRVCDHCADATGAVKLRRKQNASGVWMYGWFCTACHRHAHRDRVWITKTQTMRYLYWSGCAESPDDEAALEQIPELPGGHKLNYGEVSGTPGAELHHWFPQALAELAREDPDRWPSAYLSRSNHRLWHDLVTWYLPGARRTPEVQALLVRYRAHIESMLAWAYAAVDTPSTEEVEIA